MSGLEARIESALGRRPVRIVALAGGSICDVRRAEFDDDGATVVVKQARTGGLQTAEIEARMLTYLRTHAPVPTPEVLHVAPDLLIMTCLPSGGRMTATAEVDLARRVAELHAIRADRYGFEYDTVFATAPQHNAWMDDWVAFFRDRRLIPMARLAHEAGRLAAEDLARIEGLADQLDRHIPAHPPAALLHGDLWGGNILVDGGSLSGLVDPAISYGHAEMDLAFIGLFGSVGQAFYSAYEDAAGIAPGFFETRRDLYNLWPLLFHVKEFGAGYLGQVRRILDRFGV